MLTASSLRSNRALVIGPRGCAKIPSDDYEYDTLDTGTRQEATPQAVGYWYVVGVVDEGEGWWWSPPPPPSLPSTRSNCAPALHTADCRLVILHNELSGCFAPSATTPPLSPSNEIDTDGRSHPTRLLPTSHSAQQPAARLAPRTRGTTTTHKRHNHNHNRQSLVTAKHRKQPKVLRLHNTHTPPAGCPWPAHSHVPTYLHACASSIHHHAQKTQVSKSLTHLAAL